MGCSTLHSNFRGSLAAYRAPRLPHIVPVLPVVIVIEFVDKNQNPVQVKPRSAPASAKMNASNGANPIAEIIVTIARGNDTDLPRALELDVRAHLARSASYVQPPDLLDILLDRLRLPHTTLLLAFLEEKLVGTALLSAARTLEGSGEVIEGLAHITLVNVDPSLWGRGIGKRLMAASEESAAADGFKRAQLWVRIDVPKSVHALSQSRLLEDTGDETISAGGS